MPTLLEQSLPRLARLLSADTFLALLLVAVIVLVGPPVVAAPLFSPGSASSERTVRIEASQYAFTPGVVDVRQGERVTLELVAVDVVHGLHLDGYNLELVADPGQTSRLTFVADKPGTFRFRCAVSCGAMHPFMVGKLNVQPVTGTPSLFWGGLGLALAGALAGLWGVRK